MKPERADVICALICAWLLIAAMVFVWLPLAVACVNVILKFWGLR